METRAPNWTSAEFETLLEGHYLSIEELVTHLPRRSIGAVGAVRAFLHAFHMGQYSSGLSNIMLEIVGERRGQLICAECGRRF